MPAHGPDVQGLSARFALLRHAWQRPRNSLGYLAGIAFILRYCGAVRCVRVAELRVASADWTAGFDPREPLSLSDLVVILGELVVEETVVSAENAHHFSPYSADLSEAMAS